MKGLERGTESGRGRREHKAAKGKYKLDVWA